MRARTRAPLGAHAGLPHARRVADGLPVAGVPGPRWEPCRRRAAAEDRILVTLDGDFAELVNVREAAHAGLVRLPDVPASQRIALMAEVIDRQPLRVGTNGTHRRAALPAAGDAGSTGQCPRPPRLRAWRWLHRSRGIRQPVGGNLNPPPALRADSQRPFRPTGVATLEPAHRQDVVVACAGTHVEWLVGPFWLIPADSDSLRFPGSGNSWRAEETKPGPARHNTRLGPHGNRVKERGGAAREPPRLWSA